MTRPHLGVAFSHVLIALALPCAAVTLPALAEARDALQLKRVVMLMRHGVRSPTENQPSEQPNENRRWPEWPVLPGQLTPRGAQGAALLGRQDRSYFDENALLAPEGCPPDGTVVVLASSAQRAIDTAQAWTSAAFPACRIAVSHPASEQDDALFHPLSGVQAKFDGKEAWREAMGSLPNGGIEGLKAQHREDTDLLENVLGCSRPVCDLKTAPATLLEKPHDRPNLTGVFEVGTTASQNILLEYLEGMPMENVGWGRVRARTIEKLLAFHPVEFRYSNRPRSVARTAGGPLAARIGDALSRTGDDGIVTLMAGHDTNIADVAALLGLHWKISSYPKDDVPPVSALGFELWSDGRDSEFVRAFFRSPTMQDLRRLDTRPPERRYLDIPGCGQAAQPRSCAAKRFRQLVTEAMDPTARE